MAKAVEYIENNWNKDFNLKETAAAAGLSPYHFTRVFKNDMGMTPYSYYMKYKLERLMELLRDAALPSGRPSMPAKWNTRAIPSAFSRSMWGSLRRSTGR